VGKVTCVAAVLFAAFFCLSGEAAADGIMLKHHARKVASACADGCVVRRPACPDPYMCRSLYGAYGPYGGRGYWSMYTWSGWN
jgi:hypothetical protein